MRDVPISRSEIMDPIGKRYWPIFKGRDGCRAPMQWNNSDHAGFSRVKPWLKVNQDYLFRNVAAQKSEPNSLFYFYRKLIQLKKELPALQDGMFLPLTYDPRRIFAYLRKTDKQSVIVAVNFSSRPTRFFLGREAAKSNWQPVLSNYPDRTPEIRNGELLLLKEEACILVTNETEK
jgi:alpha-glucosidase